MCDFVSWIDTGTNLYWLNDDEIEAKSWNMLDSIGHEAIEKYFGVKGEHKESWKKIPPQIAASVNSGAMDKMAKAFGMAGIRYDARGNCIAPWWVKTQKLIKQIEKIKWFDNHAKPLKAWKLFETGDAARAAAWSAARAAAGAAAWSAAWSAAGAAAWSAAKAAARAAAWSAARAAAGAAAWSAARAAAGAAELLARMYVSEFDSDNKHYQHALKRWEVYERGYGVYCDINGELYVYKRP